MASCILVHPDWDPGPSPKPWRGRGDEQEKNAMHHPHHLADGGHAVPGHGSARFCHPGDAKGEQGTCESAQGQAGLPQ